MVSDKFHKHPLAAVMIFHSVASGKDGIDFVDLVPFLQPGYFVVAQFWRTYFCKGRQHV